MPLASIASLSDAEAFFASHPASVAVFYSVAPWSPPSQQLAEVIATLAEDYPVFSFFKVDADAPDVGPLCAATALTTVPCVSVLRGGRLVGSVPGFDPEAVAKILDTAAAAPAPAAAAASAAATAAPAPAADPWPALEARLKALIAHAPVVLFMKGVPTAPRCGFSRQVVELLAAHRVVYESFDILTDNAVREGLKKLSKWPTYPQLYADGQLVGGLDVLKELAEAGELEESLPEGSIAPAEA